MFRYFPDFCVLDTSDAGVSRNFQAVMRPKMLEFLNILDFPGCLVF